MQKQHVRTGIKVLALALLLPCLYGCGSGDGGGGSGASLSSFVFGGGDDTGSFPPGLNSPSSTDTTTGTDPTTGGGGDGLATIREPEPATMLLLGSGLVAMRLTRNRKNSLPRDQKR